MKVSSTVRFHTAEFPGGPVDDIDWQPVTGHSSGEEVTIASPELLVDITFGEEEFAYVGIRVTGLKAKQDGSAGKTWTDVTVYYFEAADWIKDAVAKAKDAMARHNQDIYSLIERADDPANYEF